MTKYMNVYLYIQISQIQAFKSIITEREGCIYVLHAYIGLNTNLYNLKTLFSHREKEIISVLSAIKT